MMELLFVFAVAFAAALSYGLERHRKKESHERALAAYRANPDLGWPPIKFRWPPPPCPPAPSATASSPAATR